MEVQLYTVNSTNSLSAVGSRANFQETSAMQSLLPCTKTREKSQTAPTIGGSPYCPLQEKFLLAYSWTGWYLPSRKTTCQKLSAALEKQGHHSHGLRPQAASREVSAAKQGAVCNVCRPDQSVRHCEQGGTLADLGASRFPPKIPQHDHSAARRPERTSHVEQQPLWTLSYPQRRETRLCPGTNSVQHLLQHDAQAGHKKTLMITRLSTSATALTAVCSISGDCRHTQRLLSSWYVTSSLPMMLPWSPTPKVPCSA